MFGSTVLEVAIGLIACFCAVSLIVSSLNEAIASFVQLRGKCLLQGIQRLLNDPDVNHLALSLYNHAQFNPLGNGQATSSKSLDHKPSYVSPSQFAQAMTDVLQTVANTPGDLNAAIQRIPNNQLRQAMTGMYQRASADITQFETELANWFDSAMQRVSARYKRTLQWWTVLFGFLVAMLFNIDTFHLFQVLWLHPTLAENITPENLANAHTALDQLSVTSLPIGWEKAPFELRDSVLYWQYSASQLALMTMGWMVTALSTLFGAPFWFDLLQKATNLRGVKGTAS